MSSNIILYKQEFPFPRYFYMSIRSIRSISVRRKVNKIRKETLLWPMELTFTTGGTKQKWTNWGFPLNSNYIIIHTSLFHFPNKTTSLSSECFIDLGEWQCLYSFPRSTYMFLYWLFVFTLHFHSFFIIYIQT